MDREFRQRIALIQKQIRLEVLDELAEYYSKLTIAQPNLIPIKIEQLQYPHLTNSDTHKLLKKKDKKKSKRKEKKRSSKHSKHKHKRKRSLSSSSL